MNRFVPRQVADTSACSDLAEGAVLAISRGAPTGRELSSSYIKNAKTDLTS
jgi:hypothetical protein